MHSQKCPCYLLQGNALVFLLHFKQTKKLARTVYLETYNNVPVLLEVYISSVIPSLCVCLAKDGQCGSRWQFDIILIMVCSPQWRIQEF